MSTISSTERRTARSSARSFVFAAVIAVAMLFGNRSALGADICWQNGISPEGHHYTVKYVPYETIKTVSAQTPHRYMAIAFAIPGVIFAANDVPCNRIPWDHEEMHLDGWEHDASGHWNGKHEVAFTEADVRPQIWTVVETEDGLKAVRDSAVASLPDAQ